MSEQPTPKPLTATTQEADARFEVQQYLAECSVPIVGHKFTDFEQHALYHRFLAIFKRLDASRAEAAALRESLASAEKQIEELKRTSGGIPPPDTTTQAVALIAASALLAHGGIGT